MHWCLSKSVRFSPPCLSAAGEQPRLSLGDDFKRKLNGLVRPLASDPASMLSNAAITFGETLAVDGDVLAGVTVAPPWTCDSCMCSSRKPCAYAGRDWSSSPNERGVGNREGGATRCYLKFRGGFRAIKGAVTKLAV